MLVGAATGATVGTAVGCGAGTAAAVVLESVSDSELLLQAKPAINKIAKCCRYDYFGFVKYHGYSPVFIPGVL